MTGAGDFYGQVNVADIRAAFNDLRRAVQAGDVLAAQDALDRYEQWADYVFDIRHRDHRPNRTPSDARTVESEQMPHRLQKSG